MQQPSSYTGVTLGGRYVLGELLGKGGFGAVYKAVQSDLGRTVAVKILHADAVLTGDGLARFAREARAAAALGHPNIAQVSDFQMRPGEPPFIVLECLEGLTLGALLRKEKRLDAPRVCAIAHQVLSALDVAHGAGIVHRDVKPDNVFLVSLPGVEDFVKLLDFGIAKLTTSNTALTGFGTMLGTPAFMAPEQVANIDVDHRADLYAVGAMLHFALSGRHAFEAPNLSAVLYAIVHQPVPTLSSIDPRIDPRLSVVVARAMHKDPSGRFGSAAEMRAALEPWSMKAPRFGVGAPAPPSLAADTVPGSTTLEADGAPTYPVGHTPSFSPSHAPPRPSYTANGPAPLAPTLDEPRSMSMPAPMHAHSRAAPPQQSKGIGAIILLVGGALALLLLVLIAGGIALYVLHDGGNVALNPINAGSTATATPAGVAAGGTSPAAPGAAPGAAPAAPGAVPKGGG
ncbi:MAG: Serine/threonine protein kinase PrkC, regulator of stationary phase, partial [Labilithrix sp.]|nr:Serine/threonine protein kinase PrkC, regulator of stationary phase [Labilithrix sp.]